MKVLNEFIRYFDLYSGQRTVLASAQAGGKRKLSANAWLFFQYLALLLGIIAKQFINYLVGQSHFSWLSLIVSIIFAIILFPGAYKGAMKSSDPTFVQWCVTFIVGYGYKSLIDVPPILR